MERTAALELAGLTEMDVAERDAYIPLSAHLRLSRAVLARLPAMNLALTVPRAVTPRSLGVLGHVIANCATLGAALDAFARFHPLLSNAIVLQVCPAPTTMRIVVRMVPELEALRHPVEAIFVMWVALARQLTATQWTPTMVQFRHAPVGAAAEHEAFFGAPVRFEQDETSMVIPRSALAIPITSARPERHAMFKTHAEAILADFGDGETTRMVSQRVAERLPSGPQTQAEIASALGVSPRTLSRRLLREGTSFGAVLDRTRRALAETYLAQPERAVYEVAFLLGYSEPSTFHRSFRRWTGLTPHQFRQRHTNER